MANFGDNLRNWMDTEWKPDDEKAMKIFEKEWKKATKNLVESTPEGQIRFALISRWKIIKKLQLNPFFFKSTHFIRLAIEKAANSEAFLGLCPSDLYFPTLNFSDDVYTDVMILLFYANNLKGYSNVGRDLVQFWFETQVLPDFERAIKKLKKDYRFTANNSELYFYDEIRKALEYYDTPLTRDEYKEIFTHLCDKNGVKLKEFSCSSDKSSACDAIKISL